MLEQSATVLGPFFVTLVEIDEDDHVPEEGAVYWTQYSSRKLHVQESTYKAVLMMSVSQI